MNFQETQHISVEIKTQDDDYGDCTLSFTTVLTWPGSQPSLTYACSFLLAYTWSTWSGPVRAAPACFERIGIFLDSLEI